MAIGSSSEVFEGLTKFSVPGLFAAAASEARDRSLREPIFDQHRPCKKIKSKAERPKNLVRAAVFHLLSFSLDPVSMHCLSLLYRPADQVVNV